MTLTLNLGVADIPYTYVTAGAPPVTTGDVAGWLENKYHVMEIFAEEVGSEAIARAFERSAGLALEAVLSGAPVGSVTPYASAETEIEEAFRQFLSLGIMEGLGYPGVPTQAALDGVSHRFKSKLNRVSRKQRAAGVTKGVRRPSFIDTGAYEQSFRAWVT